jgi:tetratricopeptide (TPR) repeat protein
MRLHSLICLVVFALGVALVVPALAQDTEALKVYARGDYEGVVKLLEGRYKSGSAKIQEHLLLARAYLHLERSDDALGVLRAVLERDRENPEANSLTGQVLFKAGKNEDALGYLNDAYRLKQDAVTASTLGKCHYALGDPRKAKVYLEKALAEDIRDPSNSFLLGKICLERGLGALAEKYLLQSEEAGMESAELRLLLGRAYVLQHKLVGPVLVERIPGGPAPGDVVDDHVVLGRLEGVADRYKVCTRYSALYEGLRLLEVQPDNADALFMAASGWLAAGDTELALKHLGKLSAKEPASRRVLELQARMLIEARDFSALERTLASAEQTKAFDAHTVADFYYRAALVLLAEGKLAEAVGLLKSAEQRWPTSAKVLRALGELSVVTGRNKDARAYYARMIELFPDAPDIDELRNALTVLQEETGAE